MRRPYLACAALMLAPLLCLAPEDARARVHMTQQEALKTAFPPPQTVERQTLYLRAEQAERAAAEAGGTIERHVVPYYTGRLNQRVTGYAYFDTHLVRTLPETILVRLTPEGQIAVIDIVSFDEPEDYLPNRRWLRQFAARGLDRELSLKGSIRVLSGATLSSRAITAAARRVLALHRLYVAPQEATQAEPADREPEP